MFKTCNDRLVLLSWTNISVLIFFVNKDFDNDVVIILSLSSLITNISICIKNNINNIIIAYSIINNSTKTIITFYSSCYVIMIWINNIINLFNYKYKNDLLIFYFIIKTRLIINKFNDNNLI